MHQIITKIRNCTYLNLFRIKSLVLSFFIFTGFVTSLVAQNLDYTMTWDNVDGTYGGTPFTGETLTFKFKDIDPATVQNKIVANLNGPLYYKLFPKGVDVTISLGTILTNASLDELTSNDLAVYAPTF